MVSHRLVIVGVMFSFSYYPWYVNLNKIDANCSNFPSQITLTSREPNFQLRDASPPAVAHSLQKQAIPTFRLLGMNSNTNEMESKIPACSSQHKKNSLICNLCGFPGAEITLNPCNCSFHSVSNQSARYVVIRLNNHQ